MSKPSWDQSSTPWICRTAWTSHRHVRKWEVVAVLSHKLWGGLFCSPIGKVIPNVCDQPLGEASQLLCSEYVFIRKASPYDLVLTKGGLQEENTPPCHTVSQPLQINRLAWGWSRSLWCRVFQRDRSAFWGSKTSDGENSQRWMSPSGLTWGTPSQPPNQELASSQPVSQELWPGSQASSPISVHRIHCRSPAAPRTAVGWSSQILKPRSFFFFCIGSSWFTMLC